MDNETKIKKIRSVLKTFKRKPAESRLDDEIPGWRELVPEWQSITRLSPGSPEYRDQILNLTLLDDQLNQEMLQDVREESQEKLPEKVDLSNKELQVRIEDELKNLLQAIRASVDLYPEDFPQYQHETDMFTSNKPQEVSLENYPNIQKLFKSFIVEHLRKGGGRPPYEPRRSEMFNAGVIDFYEQSRGLTTSGFYDINTISELGFRTVPQDLKEFMKDAGIPAVRGLSRGLREVFRYFTGAFAEPGKASISTAYSGRNPQLQRILDSLPMLAPIGEGRYIIANRLASDASDLGPVYEKYMNVKPGTGTLPEQMQLLEDTTGTGTVRSMIDPSRQVQPLETKYQRQLLQHLIRRFNEPGGLPKESRAKPVDVGAITRRFHHIKNPYARQAAIRNAIQDATQDAKRAAKNAVLTREYQQKKKKLGFQPDPEGDFGAAYALESEEELGVLDAVPDMGFGGYEEPEEEELGVLDAVPDMGFGGDKEPEEEELKKIPVPIKPKKAAKPSGSGSSLAETLRRRAAKRLKAADQKAAKRLGIPYDPKRTTAKTAEKVPVKKAEKVPTLTKKQAAAAARQKTFKYAAGPRTSTGELRGFRGRGEWGDPTRKTQAQLEKIRKEALEAADKKRQKREEAAKKAKKKPDPKNVKGFGLLWMLEQLLHTVPGMGLVDEEGRPVATLDEQMNKLTG